jgi:hypothetical protein
VLLLIFQVIPKSPTESNTYYAYYSQQAADFGTPLNIYRLKDGREVLVTCIDKTYGAPGYMWSDKVYLGETTFPEGYVENVFSGRHRCEYF